MRTRHLLALVSAVAVAAPAAVAVADVQTNNDPAGDVCYIDETGLDCDTREAPYADIREVRAGWFDGRLTVLISTEGFGVDDVSIDLFDSQQPSDETERADLTFAWSRAGNSGEGYVLPNPVVYSYDFDAPAGGDFFVQYECDIASYERFRKTHVVRLSDDCADLAGPSVWVRAFVRVDDGGQPGTDARRGWFDYASTLSQVRPTASSDDYATPVARTITDTCDDGSRSFSDVPASGAVHGPQIRCAADRGIIEGFPDGTFRPTVEVTRAQIAALVFRMLRDAGYDEQVDALELSYCPNLSGPLADDMRRMANLGVFITCDGTQPADRGAVADAIVTAVRSLTPATYERVGPSHFWDASGTPEELARAGIILGIGGGEFAPYQAVTRGEAATFTARARDHLLNTTGSVQAP